MPRPRINGFFKRSQMVTALALALSHGTNDAQKTMGIITLALVTGGYLDTFAVPIWVILACAHDDRAGHRAGRLETDPHPGRQILTRSARWMALPPNWHRLLSFLSASLVGGPVSTTQVVSSAIMGVGAAERVEQSPLGRGAGNCHGLVADHPRHRAGGCRILLVIEDFLH